MNKHKIAILLIALFSISTYAQNTNEQKTTKEIKPIKKNAIVFYPVNLVDVINGPNMLIGYERRIDQKTALKFSGGVLPTGNAYEYIFGAYSEEYRYACYRANIEFKYIVFTSKSLKRNVYLSTDVFYSNVYSNEMDMEKDIIGNEWEEIDKFNLNKFGANLKIGNQFVLNRFILEIYGGVGIAKHNEDIYKKERIFELFETPYDEITDKTVDYYRINFPFNVLVGFTF